VLKAAGISPAALIFSPGFFVVDKFGHSIFTVNNKPFTDQFLAH